MSDDYEKKARKKRKRSDSSSTTKANIKLGVGSLNEDVPTPKDLLDAIRETYGEFFDPCPLKGRDMAEKDKKHDGLKREWKSFNFVNPPFQEVERWVKKGVEEKQKGRKTLFLICARTNTQYWKKYVIPNASKIQFFLERIKFIKGKGGLPIPCCLVLFDPSKPNKYKESKLGPYHLWT